MANEPKSPAATPQPQGGEAQPESSPAAANGEKSPPQPSVAELLAKFEQHKAEESVRTQKAVKDALKQAKLASADASLTEWIKELPEDKQEILLERKQVEKEHVMNLIEKYGLDEDQDYETLLLLPRNKRADVAKRLASKKADEGDLETEIRQAGGATDERLAPGGGGVAMQEMTWDKAQRIKNVKDISKTDYERLIKA